MSLDNEMEEEKDRLFVGALARGLKVLAAFEPGEQALSNLQLAQRTALPKSTVSRLTYTLTKLGYLAQDEGSGQYRLGSAVLSFGASALGSYDMRRIAAPLMREFARENTLSISLGIRDGTDMVYLESFRSQARVSVQLSIGSRVPLATTAIGRAYYCALPESERHQLDQLLLQRYGRQWPDVQTRLQEAMQACIKDGYSESFGEYEEDVMAVGIALPAIMPGMVLMSLNASGPAYTLTVEEMRQRIAPALQRLSTRILPR